MNPYSEHDFIQIQQLKVPAKSSSKTVQYDKMPEFIGFQTVLILDQYGVPFHAVVLFCPDPDFLKSSSTYCTATQRCGA
jgi:hypothetical protein